MEVPRHRVKLFDDKGSVVATHDRYDFSAFRFAHHCLQASTVKKRNRQSGKLTNTFSHTDQRKGDAVTRSEICWRKVKEVISIARAAITKAITAMHLSH